MPNALSIWWSVLCAAAVINVSAWLLCAQALERRSGTFPAEVYATRRLLLWLAACYVLGCGFRSVFPMVDVPWLTLYFTVAVWISIALAHAPRLAGGMHRGPHRPAGA